MFPGAALSSRTVTAIFFASGATSLVYQVIWVRWLGLIFGNTTASITIVLAAFMGGLAMGSALAGRRLAKVSRPLRAYAICEAGIGAFAVVFPLLLRMVDGVYAGLVGEEVSSTTTLVVKSVLAFALLCIPTALMGATLPLLTEHFRRYPDNGMSWKIGVLYGANTLGAAFGVLFAGFVAIELLGVLWTTLCAAMCNGVIAWIASTRSSTAVTDGGQPSPAPIVSTEARVVTTLLAATGALALAGEILWTRTLSTFLGTSTYAFSTIVCTYLVGVGAGSWIMSLFVSRFRDPRLVLIVVVMLAGCWQFGAQTLFRTLWMFDLDRGVPLPIPTILGFYLGFATLLVPLAFLSGACFPLATRILAPSGSNADGELVSRAYAASTWGSVIGSFIAGFVLAPMLDFEPALQMVAVGYLVVAALAALIFRRWIERRPTGLVVVTAVLAALGLVRSLFAPGFVEQVKASRPDAPVLMHRPGLQGVTSVIKIDDTPSLFVNHHGMTVKVTDTKNMAHVPMLLHESPASTLVICFGMGTTYRSALSHGGDVTVVELVQGVVDAFPFFYDDAPRVLENPRGRIIVSDGRHVLQSTDQQFDVITIDPPPPIDGEGVNNLYSQDFAELARSRLKEGGLFAHWIPVPGSRAGVDDRQSFEMLVETFRSVFPHVYALMGHNRIGLHLIGSMTPIDTTPDVIGRRLEARPAARQDLNELTTLSPGFFSSGQHLPAPTPDVLITTDDRPLLEYYLWRSLTNGIQKVLPGHLWAGTTPE
jgi:spermidine synthase